MKKWIVASIITIILALLLVQIVSSGVLLVPVPGDKDGDKIVSKAELADVILSYMLGEPGHLSLGEIRKIAHTHVYYPRTIIDDFGRNETIVKKPERIVSLAPSNTEILFALGLGDKVVGVTEFCNYPSEAKNKEAVGGLTGVNMEQIFNLNPDLILATNLLPVEIVYNLDDYFPVFVIDHTKIKKIEDIFTRIELVGSITEEEERADQLVADMRRRVEEIENKTKGKERVNVTYIVWHDPLWIVGGENFQNDLLEKAGGNNIFSDVEGWKTVDLEELIKRNPDVIIASAGHGAIEIYDFIMSDDRLEAINARKNGRVYPINADIISRPGPRVVEALEEIAKYLHPE